jgi:hypothetical protein
MNCLDYIIGESIKSGSIVLDTKTEKRRDLLMNGVRVLKESNDKFKRDIDDIRELVRSSVLKKTPSDSLKKLFTNLKQLNDNIAVMVKNYNSFKKIFNANKDRIIAGLPDVPTMSSLQSQPSPATVDKNIEFLNVLKGKVENTAKLFIPIMTNIQGSAYTPNIPDFKYNEGPPSSANIQEVISNVIKEPIDLIKLEFQNYIREKIEIQEINFNNSKDKAFHLRNQILNCHDEQKKSIMSSQIEANVQKITGCIEESRKLSMNKSIDLDDIYDEKITEGIESISDEISDNTRGNIENSFNSIYGNCKAFLESFSNKNEIDDKFKECDELCNTFNTVTIPEIENEILKCIRASIQKKLADAKTKFDPIQEKLAEPAGEFATGITNGDGLIQQIDELLQ